MLTAESRSAPMMRFFNFQKFIAEQEHKRHVNVVVDKEALNRRSSHLQSLVFRVSVETACNNTTELSPCVGPLDPELRL